MRFDSTVYYHFGEVYPWDKLTDEFREIAGILDQAGFTTVWLAEHHFSWDGWNRAMTNPILVGADLAAHTQRIRVGQCGVILPDWHPIRVAEDIALLDNMTKGRVDFGIARGYDSRSALQFNVHADRLNAAQNYALFAETLDIIKRAWTEEVFRHEGKFYTFPVPGWKEPNPVTHDPRFHNEDGEMIAFSVYPKPFQKPHPPIYQMADSAVSHKFAGARDVGVICMLSTIERVKDHWAAYDEGLASLQEVGTRKLAVMRPTYVAETMEQAINDVRTGINYRESLTSTDIPRSRKAMLGDGEFTEDDILVDAFDFQASHDLIFVGTPDSVSEQIERYQEELGLDHLVLFHNIPGLTHEKVMNSLSLFSEKVLPRFQNGPPPEPIPPTLESPACPLPDAPAAVHHYRLSRDETGVPRCQEKQRSLQLVGSPLPPHRRPVLYLLRIRVPPDERLLAGEVPWRQGVHSHPAVGPLDSAGPSQSHHAMLRDRVCPRRALWHSPHHPQHRGQIDNPTVSSSQHFLAHPVRQHRRSDHVSLHDRIKGIEIGVSSALRLKQGDPGVVDQNVDLPVLREHPIHESVYLGRICHVGLYRQAAPAQRSDHLRSLFHLFDPAGADGQVCARFGQSLAERHPQPRRRARNYRRLSAKIKQVLISHFPSLSRLGIPILHSRFTRRTPSII